jgi:hypothetical protein
MLKNRPPETHDRSRLVGVWHYTNHQKVLDLWKGGSRRPGAIFESVNRDRDIAIHHKIKV